MLGLDQACSRKKIQTNKRRTMAKKKTKTNKKQTNKQKNTDLD